MTESLKRKTLKGTIWSSIERFLVQGITFLVIIIMARILTPSDYGLVGMLTVFIAIAQSLVDSGFSQALIRKQDRTQIDNSTVFYFNIIVGLILYMILYITAPYIAIFYEEPILCPLTRLVSLSIFINSFAVVQLALFIVNIDFKTQAKASLSAAVLSGIVGIYLAIAGYGVWAIVWFQLSNVTINVILLWIFSKWRPSLVFSWSSFNELFGFGSKLAISSIINSLYKNIYLIVIGKIYKASDLGFYTRAQQFADFPSSNLTSIIQRVTYPVLCTIQNDEQRLSSAYRRFLRLLAFIVFPLMIGLASLAKPLILIVLKEKWEYSATLLQILCLGMMWFPINSINLNLLQVKGRSDLYLKLEVWKKIIGVIILCITIPLGLIAICWGAVASSIISLIINTYYTKKIIHISLFRQLKDVCPSLLYSVSMGIIVSIVVHCLPNNELQLIVGFIVGIVYYLIITKITRSNDFKELVSFIKER